MGFVVVAEDFATTKIISTGEPIPIPFASTLDPWYPTPSIGPGFIVGYYINPSVTPISQINFSTLKKAGITDIYVLARNDNYTSVLPEAKKKADAVGIRTNAWVFPGFLHASEVAGMNISVQLDMETYDMPGNVSQVKAMREDTQGVTFSVTVKPEVWDGKQYYYLIAPYCDYIVPQLYIGDYNKSIIKLRKWVKVYNTLLPGKIVAGLQTYESYNNLTPLNESKVLAEIKVVKPYTRGIILFRYGLSDYKS